MLKNAIDLACCKRYANGHGTFTVGPRPCPDAHDPGPGFGGPVRAFGDPEVRGPGPRALARGWGGGPAGTVFVDDKIVHGGKWSARIERNAASPNQFSTLTKAIPVDF